MEKNQEEVRVTRTSDKRSLRGIRRLGQALVALAQAQLEAEAQAQAAAKAARGNSKSNNERTVNDAGSRPAGDAA